MPIVIALLLLALAFPSRAWAQVQITIGQPAEATTMDPGRSSQGLTVDCFVGI